MEPRRLLPAAAAWFCAAACLPAQSQVSPADRALFEGSSSTNYPLGRHDCRLQTLHDDIGQARQIQGHAYRRDAINLRDTLAAWQTDLEVTLSVSPRTAQQASATFADNVGTNPIVVLPRTRVSFPATQRPAAAPASDFAFRIPYATPFAWPGGGATLCIDVSVSGNLTASGPNRNFTAYLDAHELAADGTCVQPGYRFGQGCAAAGASRTHTAVLELIQGPGGLDLGITSRDGVPSATGNPAFTAVIVGLAVAPVTIAWKTECQILPSLDASVTLTGTNDQNGDWVGTVQGLSALPIGQPLQVQLASGQLAGTADLTLSDASVLVAPPLGPAPRSVARVAAGSDRTSPTGAVSFSVPVVELF